MPLPEPNFERLLTVLWRRGEPDRVPFIELKHDDEIIEAVLGERITGLSDDPRQETREYARRYVAFHHRLGYDSVTTKPLVPLVYKRLLADDTAGGSRQSRSWQAEGAGLVATLEDFERYPWPRPQDVSYALIEACAEFLPPGMKIIVRRSGVFENVAWIMGLEALSIALFDNPPLVEAMFERMGALTLGIVETVAQMEAVGAVWLGDDLGFKTSTLLSPADLRRYVFPWHRKIAAAVHARGKPFLLHSCGFIEAVMPDLIEQVGIDARHSFEDAILPVTEAKRKWGDRVALLGGVDVDLLARGSVDEVRAATRRILEACMPGGGYALGSGNSVANYVKIENFLAMLDEGWKAGRYASV
jgi:uroporphyrinogen decarboxylase